MDEGPLINRLDLREPLARTARSGAAFVPRALTGAFLHRLQEEVRRGPFRPLPEEIGPVRQQTEAYEVRGRATGFPRLAELRRTLGHSVREQGRGIRGLATWRPTEISVQRYRGGAVGITPHLDGKRYRRLVAVWETEPGSLVLLRGPGLGGLRDGRPFHRVSGPESGWRYSVGFRMEARRPS
jgi:hypothetical protein